MDQRSKNGIVDAAAFDSGAGMAPIHSRRTAAIDVLTRALLSPSIPRGSDQNPAATANTNANATGTEAAASNTVAAAAAAARSFLDTTCSVYVLDADTSSSSSSSSANPATTSIATNTFMTSSNAAGPSNNHNHNRNNITMPKIFGCWNFLHQAMNEIERFEDEQNHLATNNSGQGTPLSLLSETRLLAEIAVKVARRSDDLDRQKMVTCVENFCGSTTSNATVTATSATMNPRADAGDKENANSDSSGDEPNDTNDSQPDRNPKGRLDVNHKTDNHDDGTSNTAADNTNNSGRHDIHIILPHLVRANAEIREIVIGRIAAFSFNGGQPPSPRSMTSSTAFADPLVVETFCRFLAANAVSNGAERLQRFLNDWIIPGATADTSSDSATTSPLDASAEGDKRQRLCPEGRKRFLRHRLPPYSLVCVLYHVAAEAEMTPPSSHDSESTSMSTTTASTLSPLGTIDVLQRLSLPVMANVLLGPVLHDALQRKQLKRQLKQHRQELQQQLPNTDEDEDDMDDRIIAMGLRTILKWCTTTALSLAQTKHIGSKVKINLSRLLGEALQTDSPRVMNALADLIEDVVEQHVVPQPPPPPQDGRPKQNYCLISESRMTQTRYLMQVPDEASFRANVSEEQLHAIETKELSDMLLELSVDVEGQRFRFPSFGRDAAKGKGSPPKTPLLGEVILDDNMHSLGHSLARIAAALCLGHSKVAHGGMVAAATPGVASVAPGPYRIPGPGMLELLSKCASHPSVAICGIVLPVITPVLKTQVSLATQWLPTLQRRAIIPHHPNNTAILSSSSNSQDESSDGTYTPLLAASDVCFVEFEEFVDRFRETVLAEALNACYRIHSEYYLASCTAAIEEFCVGDVATEQTSFHLEAALFCLVVVSEQVLSSVLLDSAGAGATSPTPRTKLNANASSYLLRCTAALAKKPKSLNNPLTMAQACRFMRKYAKWFGSNQHSGILDISADLTLFILVQCATTFPDTPLSSTIQKETGVTPYSEAAKTLRCLLYNNAKHFLSNKAIAALGAGWEATFAACNRGGKLLTLEDRKDTCVGICHVLAALPKDQQQTSLMALSLASIACLEAMVERADSVGSTDEKGILSPILDRAADEIIILVTTARAFTDAISTINLGIGNSRASFAEPSMMVLRRAWPTISTVASKYSFHDSILESLQFLFVECMPTNYKSDASLTFLQNICALAQRVIKNETARQKNNRFFSPVLHFVDGFVAIHGSTFETIVLSKQSGGDESPSGRSYTEQDGNMYQCLDPLARETIQAMTSQNLLGSAWTSVQTTQGIGQSASESRSKQPQQCKRADFCSSGLAPLFSFLRTCTVHCPAFLLHVLASGGPEGDFGDDDDDAPDLFVLRKALNSAILSIVIVEADISIRAIGFLESVVSLAGNRSNRTANNTISTNNIAIRRLIGEYNLPFQTSMISALLRGMCGTLQPFVVPDACRLLFHTLSKSALSEEEFKVIVLRGLSQDHFFLGNRARSVVYEFCLLLLRRSNAKANNNNNNNIIDTAMTVPTRETLENMMTDVWRLHRFQSVDTTIERSDAVHAFCIRHGRKNHSTIL